MITPEDLARCDLEPIRFINSIQNFGALIVLDENSRVKCYSSNFSVFTGLSRPINLDEIHNTDHLMSARFSLIQTHEKNLRIIQIENYIGDHSGPINAYLDQLQDKKNLQDILNTVSHVISDLTGFDRVMIYQFHKDFHGEVVAEKLKPEVESFLGLHYPASDIPGPAREIFLENWIRIIPDVYHSPVSLVSSLAETIDLGKILLRAVSPIHLQYLKNMNTAATMTISLIIDNELWGLIACHHLTTKMIPKSLREKCEIIGRFASCKIKNALIKKVINLENKIETIHQQLSFRLEKLRSPIMSLLEERPNLLDLIQAKGVALSICQKNNWAHIGESPGISDLKELAEWLSREHVNEDLYFTSKLSEHYPQAKKIASIAAGILAIRVPKYPSNYIIWFRPEVIQTVSWAGNPNMPLSEESGKLNPRSSFKTWKESVYGQSEDWHPMEINAAKNLRNEILALDLTNEKTARIEAEKAKQYRDDLMAIVSHDLKNPLNSIQMNAQLLKKIISEDDLKLTNIIQSILRSTHSMNQLVNDILSMAKFDSGKIELNKSIMSIHVVILEAVEMLRPMANEKNLILKIENNNQCEELEYDFNRILQVLSNLIGNAIKFTPENGKIAIKADSDHSNYITIRVKDTGPGIPSQHLNHIFDRFWQLKQSKGLGTGLGLSIAKSIVESHGGKIWAESQLGEGTCIIFTLPLKNLGPSTAEVT